MMTEVKKLHQQIEKFKAKASVGEARQLPHVCQDRGRAEGPDGHPRRTWTPPHCARWATSCGTRSPTWWRSWPPSAAEKITFLAVCGKEAVARGIKAGDLVKNVCAICGGKGGGKPDSAMGGGKDMLKLDDALASVDDYVAVKLGL